MEQQHKSARTGRGGNVPPAAHRFLPGVSGIPKSPERAARRSRSGSTSSPSRGDGTPDPANRTGRQAPVIKQGAAVRFLRRIEAGDLARHAAFPRWHAEATRAPRIAVKTEV